MGFDFGKFPLLVALGLSCFLLQQQASAAVREAPIGNLRPLFEPIEPTHIPTYMGPVPRTKKPKEPPLPYSGLHKGPDTVTMCLDSGLACFKPATIEEWQALYINANYQGTLWHSPWGRDYLIPKGFNHRDDWVNQWEEASDNCVFEGRCHFPAFVLKARKTHKDLLSRLKNHSLGSLYQPFFQPDFLTLKSKGNLQYQCDRITLVCTAFINQENKKEGIFRPFLPFTYVTPLPLPPTPEKKQKKPKKTKEDLAANTGYLGSEAEEP